MADDRDLIGWRETLRARDGLPELLGTVALLSALAGFALAVLMFVFMVCA